MMSTEPLPAFVEGWERIEEYYGEGSGWQERLCIYLSPDCQVPFGSTVAACMDSSKRSRSRTSERGSQAAGLSALETSSNGGRERVLSRVSDTHASVWLPAVHAVKPRTEQGTRAGFRWGQADEL